ncbi:MAG: N-acetyldiaminopimelate deacetylase [Streptococcaceae bacterium]|nr:N-acetyldiaminopimelate deacetylase [Streptococcaceae bacterium]
MDFIQIRRKLHQMPEVGLEEFQTHTYLMEQITAITQNKPFVEIRQWQTGILVFINGTQPDKTIGWRTDIDGLPILEATELSFKSQREGFMHACGHDFHMTIALGLLESLSEIQPRNNLLILFQPAEENEAGGMLMYEAGAFVDWLPDEFYSLHVNPDLPVGTIGTRVGTLFAGTCEVLVKFTGKGGHAAFPHRANDMIVAASHFVTSVQSIVSRNVNPIEGAVVTFGSFHAGTTNNVIAEAATLHGTIRTLTQQMNELTQKRIKEIAAGIGQMFDCQVEIDLKQKGYLPVENNPQLTRQLIDFFKVIPEVNLEITEPAMTGEDFGYLLSKVNGVMFWLGVDTPFALHHPQFNPDERAISFAVKQVSSFLKAQIR